MFYTLSLKLFYNKKRKREACGYKSTSTDELKYMLVTKNKIKIEIYGRGSNLVKIKKGKIVIHLGHLIKSLSTICMCMMIFSLFLAFLQSLLFIFSRISYELWDVKEYIF